MLSLTVMHILMMTLLLAGIGVDNSNALGKIEGSRVCADQFRNFNTQDLSDLGNVRGSDTEHNHLAIASFWHNGPSDNLEIQVDGYGFSKHAWFPHFEFDKVNYNSDGDELFINRDHIRAKIHWFAHVGTQRVDTVTDYIFNL